MKGHHSYEDAQATAYLLQHEPGRYVLKTTVTDYYSPGHIQKKSAHVYIDRWAHHPLTDSALSLTLCSSLLAELMLDYARDKNLQFDTIKISLLHNGQHTDFTYEADVLYPADTLQYTATIFLNALLQQSRPIIDQLFTHILPPDQNRDQIIDSIMSLHQKGQLQESGRELKFLGFTFPEPENNMDLYQLSFIYEKPGSNKDKRLIDIFLDAQTITVYHIQITGSD